LGKLSVGDPHLIASKVPLADFWMAILVALSGLIQIPSIGKTGFWKDLVTALSKSFGLV